MFGVAPASGFLAECRRKEHRIDPRGQIVPRHEVAGKLIIRSITQHKLHFVVRFECVQVVHVERVGLAGVGTLHVHNFDHALGHMPQRPLPAGLEQHCITGPHQSLHQWHQLPFLQHRLAAGDLD